MADTTEHYTVLARRFRPQTFDDVVGQQHVAQALKNAIRNGRVAHAYLFTGARGVGKTSMARILAKALNCPNVKEAVPCNECEVCQSISAGSDVDVLEIDGASNRGIDDIRSLRANVNVKSMRSRFKVYIIDEVHMLTTDAFNALLKTLEEPPPNVKFVFCTTEPHKLLDTILSRCQRFDFSTIETQNISTRLQEIAKAEGYTVSADALELVARRAAGSMRDSQSLFDQLLAFSDGEVSADDVHRLFGTATDERLIEMVNALIEHDQAKALHELDSALSDGIQLGELVDQFLRYFRDLMVLASGGESVALLGVSPDARPKLKNQAESWGLNTILAALQILSETRSQLTRVTYGRVLAEMALVRIALLENLNELDAVIRGLAEGNGKVSLTAKPARAAQSKPTPPEKKNVSPDDPPPSAVNPGVSPTPPAPKRVPLEALVLPQLIDTVEDKVQAHLKAAERLAISGPNRLDIFFDESYDFSRQACERVENLSQIQAAATRLVGEPVTVNIQTGETTGESRPRPQPVTPLPPPPTDDQPFVEQVKTVFAAKLVNVERMTVAAPAEGDAES